VRRPGLAPALGRPVGAAWPGVQPGHGGEPRPRARGWGQQAGGKGTGGGLSHTPNDSDHHGRPPVGWDRATTRVCMHGVKCGIVRVVCVCDGGGVPCRWTQMLIDRSRH